MPAYEVSRSSGRYLTDRALASLAVCLGLLPLAFLRPLVSATAGLVTCLLWPTLLLRTRVQASGLSFSPWAWGSALGSNLCDLAGASSEVAVDGADHLDKVGGTLVLSAHLGPWERGAAHLARLGHRTAVLAAPWPGLPKTQARVAQLRARAGVQTLYRGPGGWRMATRHLRSGGVVVALLDTIAAGRPGRRSVPFVEGPVGAPDPLVRWARRQGASVVVAVSRPEGFELIPAPSGLSVEGVADKAIGLLGSAIRAFPSRWAWVRALACLPCLALLSGCPASSEPVPPLSMDPSTWVAEASGARWTGQLPGAASGRFEARKAVVQWENGVPKGRFLGVDLHLWSSDGQRKLGHVWAREAQGSWPDGPLTFRLVGWELSGKASGALDELTWRPGGGWSCGGCPLEQLSL